MYFGPMMEHKLETIYVKPYVKAYFEREGFDKEIMKTLAFALQANNHRFDSEAEVNTKNLMPWRPKIPEYYFVDYGNELTPTAARDFASYLEALIIKKFENAITEQIVFCDTHKVPFKLQAILLNVRDNILKLSEDDLPLETIRKRIQRFCIAKNINYKELKKIRRNVPKNCKNCPSRPKLPQGFLYLTDWLLIAGIKRSTFYNYYRHEYPTEFVNNRLAVATIDVF
ncbi:hypothetical protein QQ054_32060 [Oscillatoria amoena NRMC-F 0135]|nr:hypothetical protein [Oscillatoria amoena NRMC-F 0135]